MYPYTHCIAGNSINGIRVNINECNHFCYTCEQLYLACFCTTMHIWKLNFAGVGNFVPIYLCLGEKWEYMLFQAVIPHPSNPPNFVFIRTHFWVYQNPMFLVKILRKKRARKSQEWSFVLWHFVCVAFCPVTFCLCGVLSCDILSVWRFDLRHNAQWHFFCGVFHTWFYRHWLSGSLCFWRWF